KIDVPVSPRGGLTICKTELKKAKDHSTKSMINHLLRIHQIINPKEKDPNQACITNLLKLQHANNEMIGAHYKLAWEAYCLLMNYRNQNQN
ncbi:hypothetical protein VP01_14625g1, partial [Puccinia sorghi]